MDTYEAASAVFSRIQTIDPHNASKIIAFILLQDHAEKEMIRLAFGPDNLIHSVISLAKTQLGLSPTASSPPVPLFRPSYSSGPSLPTTFAQDQIFPFLEDSLDMGARWDNGGGFENENGFLRRSFSMNDSGHVAGSPSKFDTLEGLMRSNVAHQQRLAASHFMDGIHLPPNRSAVATLMMGEELRRMSRCRMGNGDANPASTQIYLTFPADSTFKEEDVSNYFSIYGPVQDVRIPYQQKRMFGFVSFVYPETVKVILAKGNPHFVCDSRVLVKPYKEKGKLPEKKRQHQLSERYELSPCGSPFGLDFGEQFEMHVGPRMYQSNQEMLARETLEQETDWQHALELQSRRLMNLQLMDLPDHHRSAHLLHHQMYRDALEGSQEEVIVAAASEANDDNPMLNAPGAHKRSQHVIPENLIEASTTFNDDIPSPKQCFLETPRQPKNHRVTDNTKPKKETESEDKVLQAVRTKNENNPHE